MTQSPYKSYQGNPLYTEYEERMGEIRYPDGFFEKLQGLSIEAQKRYFRIGYHERWIHTGWSEREASRLRTLDECRYLKSIIVKDGYIAGILVEDEWGALRSLLPERWVTLSFDSDNNGAGYKETIVEIYLLCVDDRPSEDKDNA